MKISTQLRDHQVEAVEAASAELMHGKRALVVMACGSGKTIVGQAMAERLDARRILILVPSLALLAQTLAAWRTHANISLTNVLCVCSDKTVGDDDEMLTVELPVTITTGLTEIAEFTKNNRHQCLVIATYHSAPLLARSLPIGYDFDLGIFDEAHRTSGPSGKHFAHALKDHQRLVIAKRLFLTATPRYFSSNNHVNSMTDTSVYGRIAYHLSLREAIRRGIICDYEVIVSVINNSDGKWSDVDTDETALFIAGVELSKAMHKTGARRAFTFHNRVIDAARFTSAFVNTQACQKESITAFHVNGEMTHNERSSLLTQFDNCDKAVMSNAKCLSEGVDCPAVDLVAFMQPRQSYIEITQTLGRALRNAPGKTKGYVFLPIRVDMHSGESPEIAIKRANMDALLQVLSAVNSLDDAAAQQLEEVNIEYGRTGRRSDVKWISDIKINAPADLLEYLRHSIHVHALKELADPWGFNYGQLCAFREKHGHCGVPPSVVGLYRWCSKQRTEFRQVGQETALSPRHTRLKEIGFNFTIDLDAGWRKNFARLEAFARKHSHCRVPPSERSLWQWCNTQRTRWQKGIIDESKRILLTRIGFTTNKNDEKWDANFSEFVNVNGKIAGRPALRSWYATQRIHNRKGILDPERKTKLELIGFDFSDDAQWFRIFSQLKTFHAQHGHCILSNSMSTLAAWCSKQRNQFKLGLLNERQCAALNQIGFTLNSRDNAWNNQMAELESFVETNGHARVPSRTTANATLRAWCSQQRKKHRQDLLDTEQRARLEAIGFKLN